MMRIRVLKQVTYMTFREFARTPGALFWTYGFPLLMAMALGFAFRSSAPTPLPVAVIVDGFSAAALDALAGNEALQLHRVDAETARLGLRRGRFLLIAERPAAAGSLRVTLDASRPDAELARLRVERSLAQVREPRPNPPEVVEESIPGWRYIDWLIPGLIGLNLLGAGMWGVGFNLVQMRVKNILRRMMVTPMSRAEFLVAFLFSRLVLVIPEAGAILAFGHFVFGVPITGSLLTVLPLVVLGAVSFTGLGMLVASRARSIESVSGLMNLIMLPMWLLGGCFFSNERFPDVIQPLVRALPITQFNDGLRAVVSEGAGLLDIGTPVLYLLGFASVSMGLAIRCFRWT